MAPKLTADEIDDLIYLARAGEDAELTVLLKELAEREKVAIADILDAAKDESGATCLHMAAANGHSKTVTHILSYLPTAPPTSAPAEESSQEQQQQPTSYINVANKFGNTALHWACLGNHLDTVKLLLSRGASPALANDKDQIPLDMAAFNNHMAIVEYFLSQSRNVEEENAKEGGLAGAVKDVDMDAADAEAEEVKAEGSAGAAASSS
ncbi:Ankyrin repeat-containing domain protein [Apiospora kogelbergensis]|uniref:Ankyrin repeat-containing domain protein n=1 Tax=Apiospora kogelbergensis TaxID=1337665 RepID=A0AAW0QE35_9PEZI